jgi:2-iminobutanoate/2-iminopropanoate deaminase
MEQGNVRYLNPEKIRWPGGFSHAVVTGGICRTRYICGRTSVGENGNVVGKRDPKQPAGQVFDNLEKILRAAGAGFEHIGKWNVFLVGARIPAPDSGYTPGRLCGRGHWPVDTVASAAAPKKSNLLVQMDGIAVVPE